MGKLIVDVSNDQNEGEYGHLFECTSGLLD